MASPATWRWSLKPRKTSKHSALTLYSTCNPSSFHFSHRNLTSRTTTTYRTNCSLDHNSSSSDEVRISSYTTDNEILKSNKKKINCNKKSIQVGIESVDSTSSLIEEISASGNDKSVEEQVEKKKNESLNLPRKSLFEKQKPLWKRIFFASKKVRSIILLNVISVIYGTFGLRVKGFVLNCVENDVFLRLTLKFYSLTSNIPVLKEVEAIVDPATFTVVRFTLSAIFFLPFVIQASGDAETRTAGIELGVWVSLGYLMQALGLVTSEAGRASFITLFTARAIVPTVTWIGALISIVGVTLLESSGSPPSVGDLLNFLSAVFFGVHMLRTEHFARSTKRDNFLPLLGYEVCVVAIFSIIWYFAGGWFGDTHELDPGSWTWPVVRYWLVNFPWIPAIYTGVLSTGVCLWGELSAMRDVSATETAIIYGLEPLWGAGFAWFLLGERWGITGWIGAALVLGGSLTVQIFGSESPSKARENEDDIGNGSTDNLMLSDKGKSFPPSPVVVTTTSRKKNVSEFLKKLKK
ncbi:hypothetical protein C5167_023028 [Papaver somniferum]|uniref:EamA domain-containing protein n=1 Tax=Papaver somniferum TaxID=3469 RepID=A0A4Y7JJL8_PAPSO|nr:hypothetical protein C5167_023028 [Papaver somniferum]